MTRKEGTFRTTDHYERLSNCLKDIPRTGQPFALWRHFPEADQTPEGLARATTEWQRKWDFDFVKATPAGSYSVRDYGVRDQYRGDPFGRRETVDPLVTRVHHWEKIRPLDPEAGFLGQQLRALRLINSALGRSAPVIQTIFSPFAQMEKISGSAFLYQNLTHHPELIGNILGIVTRNTVDVIRACIQTGVDGIFFVVRADIPESEALGLYRKFGMPYDQECLKAATELLFNILHLHAEWCRFADFYHYPAAMISMDRVQEPDEIAAALKGRPIKFLGGFSRDQMSESDGKMTSVFNSFRKKLGSCFVAGANCALALATPDECIHKVRELANRGTS